MDHEDIDEDLQQMSRAELIEALRTLRSKLRAHRDASGHALCWHQPDLWDLLPERVTPTLVVPEWPQFLRGCIRYRQSLDAQQPDAPRVGVEFEG